MSAKAKADLLVEIGTEEIPSRFIPGALQSMSGIFREGLDRLRLAHGEVHLWGTPRRLAVLVEGVDLSQRDMEEQVVGPPASVAYDADGQPTPAALGFAKKQGVEVSDLRVVNTQRGDYVAAVKEIKGRPAQEVLTEEIPRWVLSIPFQKSMRWSSSELRFVRPIHWIVALMGDDIIPFELDHIRSGRLTRGHRFLHPSTLEVDTPGAYLRVCREGYVIADPKERERLIIEGARQAATEVNGRLVEDPKLLEELVFLTEYPIVICGSFDKEFLSLPREVLVTAMREHQKFFSVEDERGRLLPCFVGVSNIKTDGMDVIRRGNERVLRARLSDARFFFNEDMKRPLVDRVEDLRGVIFHSKLGTLYQKTMRIQRIALQLAQRLDPDCTRWVERASLLCKADLTTEMVGEFPSLQGVMGRHYALLQGEEPQVAVAIEEHYLPAFAADRLPSTDVGAVVGISDKIDTISGCFAVGDIPTGAGDPFGLRRAALGILRILLEKGYPFYLDWIVELAIEALRGTNELEIKCPDHLLKEEVMEFLRVRLANLWQTQGHEQDVIEAVLSVGFGDLPGAFKRMKALETFKDQKGFEDLALAFKRITNILSDTPEGPVDPGLFQEPAEKALYEGLLEARQRMTTSEVAEDPVRGLRVLAELRPVVDEFFDAVLVNAEDPQLRANRLRLLASIRGLFLRIADLSKVQTRT